VTAACGTLSCFERNLINSRFAAPSTGGAAMRIRNTPSCRPAVSLRDARGTTRTEKVTPPECSRYHVTRPLMVNAKSKIVNQGGQKNCSGQSRSRVEATTVWHIHTIKKAISGEISNMPTVGSRRRNGARRGSVARTKNRISRFT